MCGRFTLHHSPDQIAARFGVQGSLFPDLTPRFNIAPTQTIPVITAHGPRGERLLEPMLWGLVPSWAKDPGSGARLINARSETAHEKPSFRNALKRRRCLIPADGFYEWERATRVPRHFRLTGGRLFALAGLFDEWLSPDGSPLRTCAILTTGANSLVAPIHDRMPVILSEADEAGWLDVQSVAPADLLPCFAPCPESAMEAYAVGKRVGSPANDDAGLIAPA